MKQEVNLFSAGSGGSHWAEGAGRSLRREQRQSATGSAPSAQTSRDKPWAAPIHHQFILNAFVQGWGGGKLSGGWTHSCSVVSRRTFWSLLTDGSLNRNHKNKPFATFFILLQWRTLALQLRNSPDHPWAQEVQRFLALLASLEDQEDRHLPECQADPGCPTVTFGLMMFILSVNWS